MKKHVILLFLFTLLIGVCFQTGCWQSRNPANEDAGFISSTPIIDEKIAPQVSFRIVLPNSSFHSDFAGLTTDNLKISPEVRAGAIPPTVTFRLTTVNINNLASPTFSYEQTVQVASNGSAVASFTKIPATTCIAYAFINGGNIQSFTDFHGAADLVSNASNTISIAPIGSKIKDDVVAEIVEYVVLNPTLFANVKTKFATTVKSRVDTLEPTSATFPQDALNQFITYLNPPTQAITPEKIRQAQIDLVKTGALPDSPTTFWIAGETSVTKSWGENFFPLAGCSSPTHGLLTHGPLFSTRADIAPPSAFSWRDKDLKNWLSPIRNQGPYGTCVAFAGCGVMEAMMKIQANIQNPDLSEYSLFFSGNNGNRNLQLGWNLLDCADYLKNNGVVSEEQCPYSSIPNYREPPPSSNKFKLFDYQAVKGIVGMKQALMQGPLMSSMTVYSDFFYYLTGVYRHVAGNKAGGHAIVLYGWDDSKLCWLARNSWGTGWGEQGYFQIAYGETNLLDNDEWGYSFSYNNPTIKIPDAPKLVSANPDIEKISLSWADTIGATSYNVYWSNVANVDRISGNKVTVTNNSFIHDLLSSSKTYYYFVTAVNSAGESANSFVVSATPKTTPIVPIPENVQVIPGNREISITWNPVDQATSYNLYWSNSSNFLRANANSIKNVSSPYIHSGLTNGNGYYYFVTAVTPQGESANSQQAGTTPSLPAPTGLSAIPSDGKMALSWNNVVGATGYNLYWKTQPGVNRTVGNRLLVSSPYLQTGLTNGTSYYYVLTAFDGTSESLESDQCSAIPSKTPIPAAPTNVTLIPDDGKVTVSWNSVSGATNYNIYWATSAGVTPANGTKISAVTSPYVQINLTNGQKYYYVITSANSSGESPASEQVSTTLNQVPAKPGNLTVVPGNTKTTISWNNLVGATSYNMYWSVSSNVTFASNKVTGISNPYSHTGLSNGVTYYYAISAITGSGSESPLSSVVSAVPFVDGTTEIAFGKTISGLNQNMQVIITNVPENFSTETQVTDSTTSEKIVLSGSPVLSYPNFRRLVLGVKGATLRVISSFSSLTFTNGIPAGARVNIFDAENGKTVASVDVPGGNFFKVSLGKALTGLDQNTQVIISNVSSDFDASLCLTDLNSLEEVKFLKSAVFSFPYFQRLVLAPAEAKIRDLNDFDSLIFSKAIPNGARVEVYNPETRKSLATVNIPGGGYQFLPLGKTISKADQNLQVIVTNVPESFTTTALLIDDTTCESVVLSKSATLSYPYFHRLLLGVSNSQPRILRDFDTLVFSTHLPSGAKAAVFSPEAGISLAEYIVP
ncbi:MAG: hypothetical protein HQM08_29780 [Candidatus Riflebacteria bacterium]|nr:hypothetical protein [Candidatus Riflebacteria bacterium]